MSLPNYSFQSLGFPDRVCTCLVDGKVSAYDLASRRIDGYDDPPILCGKIEYIGRGIIKSVNGVDQGYSLENPDHYRHFWRWKETGGKDNG